MTSHTPQPPAGDDLVARLREGFTGVINVPAVKRMEALMAEAAAHIEALTSLQHTEPVAGEVEVVAWLTEGAVKGHTVSLYKPFEGGEFNPHRSPPRNPIPEPLVTKSSYDALLAAKAKVEDEYLRAWNERDAQRRRAEDAEALAAAKDAEIYAVHEAYKDRIDDLQSRRDAGLEAAERQRDALRESLCWAMDEIDVLSKKLCLFAYPQGMKYVEREDQRESYVQAVTTRRAALNDQGGAT